VLHNFHRRTDLDLLPHQDLINHLISCPWHLLSSRNPKRAHKKYQPTSGISCLGNNSPAYHHDRPTARPIPVSASPCLPLPSAALLTLKTSRIPPKDVEREACCQAKTFGNLLCACNAVSSCYTQDRHPRAKRPKECRDISLIRWDNYCVESAVYGAVSAWYRILAL
jgi:hypothetical protein